jgi:hypothetical protein
MHATPQRTNARTGRVGLVALALVSLVLGALAITSPSSGAAGPNRAAVIVETGADTHRVLIEFDAESISGLEALELAGAQPSIASWTGMGGAVCALYGVGHPANQQECLGTPGDQRFWAYWHVPAGGSGFTDETFSRAGGSSVRVRDGDVEGWRYGTGEPPEFVAFASLVPPPPPPPPTDEPSPSTRPAGSGPSVGPAGPSGAGGPSATVGTTTTTRRASIRPAAPSRRNKDADKDGDQADGRRKAGGDDDRGETAGKSGDDAPPDASDARSRQEVDSEQASASREGSGGGGSAWALIGFAIVMGALAAAIYVAHRARVGRSTAGP